MSSNKFHIKFDVSDLGVKIKTNQLYNHFPDNRELTTKAGLCKNLWSLCPHESTLQVSHFFPRCYDLSDTRQADHFIEDFQQTTILSIIKIFAEHFIKDEKVNQLLEDYKRKKEFKCPTVFKKQFKFRCQALDPTTTKDCNKLLMIAFNFGKALQN